MIDRISGRARAPARGRGAPRPAGRLVRPGVAAETKAAALDTQIGDASAARLDAVIPAEPRVEAERQRPPSPSPRDSGRLEMSEILRQLSGRLAAAASGSTASRPAPAIPSTGGEAVPITLSVKGRYFRLAKFLHLLRRRLVKGQASRDRTVVLGRRHTFNGGVQHRARSTCDQGGRPDHGNARAQRVRDARPRPCPRRPATTTTRVPRWLCGSKRPGLGENAADRCEAAPAEDPRIVVLVISLARVLAWEVPNLLHRGPAAAASAAVPAAPAAASPKTRAEALRIGKRRRSVRPRALSNGDAHAAPLPGRDPFACSAGRIFATPRGDTPPPALPATIVIGRPGGHRVAKRGWIVILASIPTRNGRRRLCSFARGARRSVGGVSVLNSSNRRPLRGGYWVVYTGPYSTLARGLATRGRASTHRATARPTSAS